MALATSSGCPSRRIGISAISVSVPGDRIVVSISPGEMALTRTARGSKSAALSRLSATEPRTSLALRRDRSVVDQRVQPAALRLQPFLHHGDGSHRVVWIGEVDLDVVLWPSLPRAILGKALA